MNRDILESKTSFSQEPDSIGVYQEFTVRFFEQIYGLNLDCFLGYFQGRSLWIFCF